MTKVILRVDLTHPAYFLYFPSLLHHLRRFMNITIDKTSKLGDIKKKFNRQFPFLKLEFFKFKPDAGTVFSRKNQVFDPYLSVETLSQNLLKGSIGINGQKKTGTLEYHFLRDFGLYVQVFRKSGKVWIDTTSTDDMTLAAQNKMAKESIQQAKKEIPTDMELYHEQL
jgi:hypothetical protein